jgi:tetratricopeptide (TPR) repeat protein
MSSDFDPKQVLDVGLANASKLVLVLDDATRPRALSRLWPLYEFYYALEASHVQEKIIFTEQEENSLLESLLDEEAVDLYASCAYISEHRVEHGLSATRNDDESRIREKIKKMGTGRLSGFAYFADKLRAAFHQWLRTWLQERKEIMWEQSRNNWAMSALALARVMQQFPQNNEDVQDALALYNEMLTYIDSLSQQLQPHVRFVARVNRTKAFKQKGLRQEAVDEWRQVWADAQSSNDATSRMRILEAKVSIMEILIADGISVENAFGVSVDHLLNEVHVERNNKTLGSPEHKWASQVYMHALLGKGLYSSKVGDDNSAYQSCRAAMELAHNSYGELEMPLKMMECYNYLSWAESNLGLKNQAIESLQKGRRHLRKTSTESSAFVQEVDERIRSLQCGLDQ